MSVAPGHSSRPGMRVAALMLLASGSGALVSRQPDAALLPSVSAAGPSTAPMDAPIVFIYDGDCPDYQQLALEQALLIASRVVLLSRSDVCKVMADSTPGVEYEDIDELISLSPEAARFQDTFPTATLKYEYEKGCIERWYILDGYMKKRQLEWAFYADSDTLLFAPVAPVIAAVIAANQSYALSHNVGHFSVASQKWLDSLTAFIALLFDGRNGSKAVLTARDCADDSLYKPGASICNDMTLLDWYARGGVQTFAASVDDLADGGKRTHETNRDSALREDAAAVLANAMLTLGTPFELESTHSLEYDGLYDHHLTCCKGDGRTRSSSWGWEKIVWGDDGRPYFVYNATGELVLARGLHYQGYKKPCMANYMNAHVAGCSCDDCDCELCAEAVQSHVVARAKKTAAMRAMSSSDSALQPTADEAVSRVRPYLRLAAVFGAQNLLLANASAATGCAEGVVGLRSAAAACFGASSALSLSCHLCDDASLSGEELVHLIRSFGHNRTVGGVDVVGDGPSVLVFGMGHSGTSSVATLLSQSGFNVRTPLAQYAEEAKLVELDNKYLDATECVANVSLPEDAVGRPLAEVPEFADLGARLLTNNSVADALWADYPAPALWKDPRTIWTLHLWTPIFEAHPELGMPLLLHVRRDAEAIAQSYVTRKEFHGAPLEEVMGHVRDGLEWEAWQMQRWPGDVLSVAVESLTAMEVVNHKEPKAAASV